MIFVLFSQHASNPIEISATGSIKGFATSLEKAQQILQEILIKENQQDKVAIHGVIIQYQEGALESSIWTLTKDQYIVSGYECQNQKCIVNRQVPVDDLDARTIGEDDNCIVM